jgi:hypothetical protein
MGTRTACMAVLNVAVLALGATLEAQLPRKGGETPRRQSQQFIEGLFLPPSFGGQHSGAQSYLKLGGRSVAGWHLRRAWRGQSAVSGEALSAFSSPAEEASSQADLSGIRPDGGSRFHTRLTPVSYD